MIFWVKIQGWYWTLGIILSRIHAQSTQNTIYLMWLWHSRQQAVYKANIFIAYHLKELQYCKIFIITTYSFPKRKFAYIAAANWLGEMSMWAKFFLAHCNSFKKYVMNIMGLHTNPRLPCEHYKVQIFRPISLKWSVSEACGCIKSPLLSIGQVWILLRIISSFEP